MFVLGGGPEVLALVRDVLLLQGTFFGDEGDAALLPEWWIGEDHAETLAGIGSQRVHATRDGRGVGVHAVQVEVHGAQPARLRHQLEAADESTLEVPILVGIEFCAVLLQDVLVGGDEKAAGAAGRIADGVVETGPYGVYDAFYERTG